MQKDHSPQVRYETAMRQLSLHLDRWETQPSSDLANVIIQVWEEVHALLTSRSRDELSIMQVHRVIFSRAYSYLMKAVQEFGIFGSDLKLPYDVPPPPEYFDADDV